MSANPNQLNIYLTPERRKLLDEAMQKSGKGASETIEAALRQYLQPAARASVEKLAGKRAAKPPTTA